MSWLGQTLFIPKKRHVPVDPGSGSSGPIAWASTLWWLTNYGGSDLPPAFTIAQSPLWWLNNHSV